MDINEKQLAAIIELTSDLVITADITGKVSYINAAGQRMLEFPRDKHPSTTSIYDFYSPAVSTLIINEAIPAAIRDGLWISESRLLKCNGQEIPILQTIKIHKQEHGDDIFISIVARDISVEKTKERATFLLTKLFESTQEGIMITDINNNILTVNPAFLVTTGYPVNMIIGQNPRILKSGLHSLEFYQNLWNSLNCTGQWQGEIWNRRKNGEIYPEWVNINVIKDSMGVISNYVAIFTDITAIKLTENRLLHLAHHDALTGLPNRLLFQDRLKLALTQSHRNKRMAAVMFIDLDHFKPINDNFGHRIGDQLLQIVAEKLTECVREGDTVARLGGDEFVIILVDIFRIQDCRKIAQKIINICSSLFTIEGHKLQTSASIGISLYPSDGINIDELVKNADSAMYLIKKNGGNSYNFHQQLTSEA